MSVIPLERIPAFVDELPQLESRLPPERRKRVRAKVRWPVWLYPEGVQERLGSITQNLSSSGFYCLAETPLTVGDTLLCLLKVPSHEPNGKDVEQILECRTRVVRVEAHAEGRYGIACRIEDYHFTIVSKRRTATNCG
jgi:hypothetical protein